ncbi:hypothetical protein PRUPE_1G226700 [Prunus persica]|uniref:Transcription factor CBF/NF-Y/archaeal histone domain-containing protein n=1 Tax=Prunus persica TaxID=3760 RepID=A0A251R1V1_PRUPE|nr:hypothetical protein PRUPE_1G226700 [Prunus persica]ONI30019.1 hypothetical protein PRUPE_1G226700 [Prunus persica]
MAEEQNAAREEENAEQREENAEQAEENAEQEEENAEQADENAEQEEDDAEQEEDNSEKAVENAAVKEKAKVAQEEENAEPIRSENSQIRPEFPNTRVKRIMKLDRGINKVNSEALLLVSCSAQLFLEFLAERSAEVATEKKRKIVKLEHMRVAVKRHRPTSDFLLDELPVPSQPSDHQPTDRSSSRTVSHAPAPARRDRSRSRAVSYKPAPAGTRRIDHFFRTKEIPIQTEQSLIETEEAPIETEEASIEIDEAPIETDEGPIETGEGPIETNES